MANPFRGEATFKAGDTEYTLSLDIEALIKAEELSEFDMPVLLAKLDSGNWKALRAIIWAGLKRDHPDLVPLRAAEIIVEAGAAVASAAMRKALIAALPAHKGTAADANPPEATTGTGSAG